MFYSSFAYVCILNLISTKQTPSEASFIKEKQELFDKKKIIQAMTALQQYHKYTLYSIILKHISLIKRI